MAAPASDPPGFDPATAAAQAVRRDWRLLLGADGVSALGSQVTAVALPLVAIAQLGASTVAASQLLLLSPDRWRTSSAPRAPA
jgi:hypothetical protein